MYKTLDGTNIGFEAVSKNKRQRQPRRFEKEQNRTSRNKETIFGIKALNEFITIKGTQIKN